MKQIPCYNGIMKRGDYMGYIILNGVKSTDKGMLLKSGYSIPLANETIENIEVLGRREGTLTQRTGTYPNISFTLNFVIKNWKRARVEMKDITAFVFNDFDNKLFVNNDEYYYEIISKKLENLNYTRGNAIEIGVTFTTRPFLRKIEEVGVGTGEVINHGIIQCSPLFKLTNTVNKDITITCNGQEFFIEKTNSDIIYVDSERFIVYNNEGTSFKTIGEFPKLEVGSNSVTCNVSCEIFKRELYLL